MSLKSELRRIAKEYHRQKRLEEKEQDKGYDVQFAIDNFIKDRLYYYAGAGFYKAIFRIKKERIPYGSSFIQPDILAYINYAKKHHLTIAFYDKDCYFQVERKDAECVILYY